MSLLDEAVAQAASLEHVDHRPWPLPEGTWLMGQTWRSLLFAHWRVPAGALRSHVPVELELEEHDGSAWVGLTPFVLSGVRVRGLPPLPLLSRCCELNCRTYVRRDNRPGIWFFSLDASSRLFVESARRVYRLPYHHAQIEQNATFRMRRGGVTFESSYRGNGAEFAPQPGTLEHFLTERYCLYADEGRARADIHHRPWRLRRAEGEVAPDALPPVALAGEPLLHLGERQDVVVFPLEQI